jgi:adenylylsulfate kinase-like enzyme
MPCMVDISPEEEERDRQLKYLHNSSLAELFCKTMWNEHKLRDQKRINQELQEKKIEEDRKAAIEKLSPYERKLLKL